MVGAESCYDNKGQHAACGFLTKTGRKGEKGEGETREASGGSGDTVSLILLGARGHAPQRALQPHLRCGQTITFLELSGVRKSTLLKSLGNTTLAPIVVCEKNKIVWVCEPFCFAHFVDL